MIVPCPSGTLKSILLRHPGLFHFGECRTVIVVKPMRVGLAGAASNALRAGLERQDLKGARCGVRGRVG